MYYIDDVLKSISTLDHSNLHYIIMLHFCCSHSFFFTFVSRFPLLFFSLFLNLLLHFENTQTLKKRYRYIIVFKTHWVTLYHSEYEQLISYRICFALSLSGIFVSLHSPFISQTSIITRIS